MSTVGDLVQDVRRELLGMTRPEYNELGADMTAIDTTATVTVDPTSVSIGSMIAIDDEILYVWAITGTSLTLRRGMLGTDAAAHVNGALIEVNPRFPNIVIRDALRREILAWAPRVAAIETAAISIISGERSVDLDGLPTDWIEILEVLRSPRANANTWIPVGWRAERNMAVADYPSGSALFLDTEGEIALDLRVSFMRPYDVSAFDDTVDLDVIGLAPTQMDIAVLGALWRLVITREIKRNFIEAQGDPRSAQEVPPGAIANSGRVIKALRDERLREEMNRIRAMYPFRRR